MKIKKLAHIGVGVKKLNESTIFYTNILKLSVKSTDKVGELITSFIPVGETNIELVQSTTSDGIINNFITKKGEGIHHIAFEVDNIDIALAELNAKGIQLTSNNPRIGAHGAKVLFLHPKDTNGVLIELCEYPPKRNNF